MEYRITWHCVCGALETLEYEDDKIEFGDDPLCECGRFMTATEDDVKMIEACI